MNKFVEYDETYLDFSWQWLNESEVKALSDTPDFTKQQQIDWFNGLKNNPEYRIWGVESNGVAVGAAGLKKITEKDACIFWYIGEKQTWGKGIGTFIASEISKIGISLGLDVLYGFPLVSNYRSLNLLFKEGYRITEYLNNYYRVEKKLNK